MSIVKKSLLSVFCIGLVLNAANVVAMNSNASSGTSRMLKACFGLAATGGALYVVAKLWNHFFQTSLSTKNEHLFYAIEKGNLEKVKYWIAKGADVNAQDEDGDSALLLACHDPAVFKYCISLPALDINSVNHSGDSLLMQIVRQGEFVSEKVLKKMVQYALSHPQLDINYENNQFDATALHLAIENDAPLSIIRLLVEHGANNLGMLDGSRLIQFIPKLDIELLKLLLQYKVRVRNYLSPRGSEVLIQNYRAFLNPAQTLLGTIRVTLTLSKRALSGEGLRLEQRTKLSQAIVRYKAMHDHLYSLLLQRMVDAKNARNARRSKVEEAANDLVGEDPAFIVNQYLGNENPREDVG